MNILLIGCGNMGGAMLSAWLESGLITRAVVVDHAVQEIRHRFSQHGHLLDIYPDVENLPHDATFDLSVLAVKPQQMTELLASLAPYIKSELPILTIAAGLRTSYYKRYLPGHAIIRAMPNLPAMIGRGMTVGVRDTTISEKLIAQIETLLTATGDFFWLDSEQELDAAMAISGSGPAYFFYLAENLAKTGVTNGLTEEQAMRLARQTLIGAGAVADARASTSLMQLRKDVTSPGGVTAAAIKVWDTMASFQNLIQSGINANVQRAQELADT